MDSKRNGAYVTKVSINSVLSNEKFLQGVWVLLVEDEPDSAHLFAFVCEHVGAEVIIGFHHLRDYAFSGVF